ncbi:MAG: alpha/beta fold hydrolase [Bacteroidia bacterium]|nr:alpha/beta fold hydrolase [Bacteroidia bacterium]
MNLYFRTSGQGKPLVILHGLFGSSDNWFTLAKTFSLHFKVYLIDMRNHGQSPHSEDFNYKLLAEDLEEFLENNAIEKPFIIGHSMGGKAAMNLAVKRPDMVSKLIVVDIVPKSYPVHHDHILEGLDAIQLEKLSSRSDADQFLSRHIPEAEVRQFLLKNLTRKPEGGFEWKINLKAIHNHIEEIGEGMQYPGKFEGPTLFIKGGRSNYFSNGDEELIKSIFTNATFSTLDSGHWVQAEKPVEFADSVMNFLSKKQ